MPQCDIYFLKNTWGCQQKNCDLMNVFVVKKEAPLVKRGLWNKY